MNEKIKEYIAKRPWLKIVFAIAEFVLGHAKANEWFQTRYKIK